MLIDTTKKLAFLFTDIGRKVFSITHNNSKIFDAGTLLYGFIRDSEIAVIRIFTSNGKQLAFLRIKLDIPNTAIGFSNLKHFTETTAIHGY